MSLLDGAPRTRTPTDVAIARSTSVAIVYWPDEADLAADLGSQGRPLLMLVAPDAEPPAAWDRLSDWLRLPTDERDIRARIESLQRRAERPPAPVIDEFDVVWRGARWVALSPVEARVLAVLLDRAGSVLTRRELNAECWKDGVPGERAVDARLPRLRSRIAPLGLRIRTIRSRGFLLEVSDPRE